PPRPGGRPGVSVIRPVFRVGAWPVPEDAARRGDHHGVTAVLSLQDDADLASKGIELRALERAYREHGLGFHRIPVPDGEDRHLAARLGEIVGLLGRLVDGGERVYLHCNAGHNRAPTAAIAYLHVREGLSLEAARDAVKQARPCVPYMGARRARPTGSVARRAGVRLDRDILRRLVERTSKLLAAAALARDADARTRPRCRYQVLFRGCPQGPVAGAPVPAGAGRCLSAARGPS